VSAQSYPHWELILVDDASTDNSLEVIAKSVNDERVQVILSRHGGVSSARNLGLKLRKGAFCLFLDSDDTFEPFALQRVADFIIEFPEADIIQFGYKRNSQKFSAKKRACFTSEDYFSNGGLPPRTVWNNCFRSKFFENIEFSHGIRVAEDAEVSIRCYLSARHIGQMPDVLYDYRVSASSAMHSSTDAEKVRDHIRVIDNLIRTLKPESRIQKEALQLAIEQVKVSFFHALFNLRGSEIANELVSEYRSLPNIGKAQTKSLRLAEFSYKAYFYFLKYFRRLEQ
jgi:glycosyltransferase involved in cell wall biosynthesis